MRESQALNLLESLKPNMPDVIATTGIKRSGAYLLLTNRHDAERWAVVYTPGDRYFSVETNDQYSRDHFEEDTPDDDVRDILERFLKIGLAYARGSGAIVQTGFLRSRVLVIEVGENREVLRQRLFNEIALFFKTFKRSTAGTDPPK